MRLIVSVAILVVIIGVGAYTTGWFGTPETPTESQSN